MSDLLNTYSDRNGCYGHGDYGSRLIKKRHHPKRMMPQAFQNLQCKYTILLMLFYYLGDYLRLVFANLNSGIIHKRIALL